MTQYLTYQEYAARGGSALTPESADAWLVRASSRIDALTFNRIVALGFESLTEFQQETIKRSVMEQAEFESENADVIESALAAYSLNGVSVSYGAGFGVVVIDGAAVKRSVADALKQTGLMCRSFSWRRQ